MAARLRALRPPKAKVDPSRPLGVLVEEERVPGGGVEKVLTVFLAGSECPFTCVFCDLFRHTLDHPTPPGALPRQLQLALSEASDGGEPPRRIKLYNASNFFDPHAVPPADIPALLVLLEPFDLVVVECHPRLLGASCLDFARRLKGRLQVGVGLETAHPQALARLNKGATLADFDHAATLLREAGIGLRAFVLVGLPFIPPREALSWTTRSVAHAQAAGAEVVCLIPVRPGNGELERLAALGEFAPPSLIDLEAAHDAAFGLGPGVVIADLWDAARLAACPSCRLRRLARLRRANRTGLLEARVTCRDCAPATPPP